MKILLVSWSILPRSGGSSVVIENLAKNFQADEMIVLGGRNFFTKKVNRPIGSAEFRYFFSELDFFGRGARFFNWFRKWRKGALIEKIKTIILQDKITHVIGVFPNEYYCHAACLAAQEMKISFSSYFHNTYFDNTAITDPNAKLIQTEIFKKSENIFVMSKGMQRFYEKKYQLNKFIPLVHTFNDFPKINNPESLPLKKEHYKLVAIGNFNESNMEATIRFVEAIKDNPKFTLSLYTPVPPMFLRKRGLDLTSVDYKGYVKSHELQTTLQTYDMMILTHGFEGKYGEIEYQTIFPTRIIQFLLAGKPIFVHSPKGSFLNEFVEANQCAALVDVPNKKMIVAGLESIANDLEYQKELVRASRKTVRQFHSPHVVQTMKENLLQS
ncbi:MAG: glycosyltransferase family 4 protein [Saprospiraceae bacterium]